ncbi:hypothetical protein HGRIS_003331 [Hohenbuehelia grisea]|uniref:DUF6532 domain-containing protein n=1 Tax=Hohenbuehelia grisea TaxID=104357 RepID=A0ABR3JF09_9AGAR
MAPAKGKKRAAKDDSASESDTAKQPRRVSTRGKKKKVQVDLSSDSEVEVVIVEPIPKAKPKPKAKAKATAKQVKDAEKAEADKETQQITKKLLEDEKATVSDDDQTLLDHLKSVAPAKRSAPAIKPMKVDAPFSGSRRVQEQGDDVEVGDDNDRSKGKEKSKGKQKQKQVEEEEEDVPKCGGLLDSDEGSDEYHQASLEADEEEEEDELEGDGEVESELEVVEPKSKFKSSRQGKAKPQGKKKAPTATAPRATHSSKPKRDAEIDMEEGDPSLVGKKKGLKSRTKPAKPISTTSKSASLFADDEDGFSSGNEDDEGQTKKKSTKIKLEDFDELGASIVQKARNAIRLSILNNHAFPLDKSHFIWEQITAACVSRKEVRYLEKLEENDNQTPRKLMIIYCGYVIASLRNLLKTAAVAEVQGSYNIVGLSTPSQIKGKVEWLIDQSHFHYREANAKHQTFDKQAPFSHPCIADVIRRVFFESERGGEQTKEAFAWMLQHRQIPIGMMALALTAIHHAILEFQDGRRSKRGEQFRANVVTVIYNHHLSSLKYAMKRIPRWMKQHLSKMWHDLIRQCKPAFIQAMQGDDGEDMSGAFAGVDFEALEDNVPEEKKVKVKSSKSGTPSVPLGDSSSSSTATSTPLTPIFLASGTRHKAGSPLASGSGIQRSPTPTATVCQRPESPDVFTGSPEAPDIIMGDEDPDQT